jgi:hypothetical protein
VLLAVALPQALVEAKDQTGRADNKNSLQKLLERGGWHHLSLSHSVRVYKRLNGSRNCVKQPTIGGCVPVKLSLSRIRRNLVVPWFDFKGRFNAQGISFLSPARDELQTCTSQGEALWALLGGAKDVSRFEIFTRLLELNQAGMFDDVLLRLRRTPAPDEGTDSNSVDIGILRYEELSDGEQMVLGRMALFHLLEGQQDALLLLDEPRPISTTNGSARLLTS